MDFSKLSSNDKLAVYGAAAAIVGAFLSFGGAGSFGLLTGIAMLIIVFLPQVSPSTKLPGSKGSLMLIVGGLAALAALAALLALISYGFLVGAWVIGLILSIVGGLLMGWASWQEFQAEGGKFTIGTVSTTAPPAPSTPAEPMAPPPPPPPAPQASAQPMPPAEPMAPSEPMGRTDESDEDRTR